MFIEKLYVVIRIYIAMLLKAPLTLVFKGFLRGVGPTKN